MLGCMLQLLQQLAGINTLMYYSSEILSMAGIGHHNPANTTLASAALVNITTSQSGYLDDDIANPVVLGNTTTFAPTAMESTSNNEAICLSAATASAQLVGCLIAMAIVDRLGRRILAISSMLGIVASLVILGYSFYGELKPYLAVSMMIVYLLVFGCGMSPMPWVINGEIYPLTYRSLCVSLATGTNWIANYVVSVTFLDLSDALSSHCPTAEEKRLHPERSCHPDGAFWLYAGITAAGTLYLFFALPETKGKTLEEIEQLFDRSSAKATTSVGTTRAISAAGVVKRGSQYGTADAGYQKVSSTPSG